MNRPNWKIYVVTHDTVLDSMFIRDRKFNNDNYVMLNVGPCETLKNSEKYSCINQYDLTNAVKLGKWWAESEGIYNIWRSGVYKKLDYIGFLQYDKELRLIQNHGLPLCPQQVTGRIEQYIRKRNRAHISFETHLTEEDYAQNIMADIARPNELVGDGINCYDYIINDYNQFFGTNISIQQFIDRKKINLCSCFLIDTITFSCMMTFWDWVVESRRLEMFDTDHKNRLQGGLAERYFGVFLMFAYNDFKDLSLIHHWIK